MQTSTQERPVEAGAEPQGTQLPSTDDLIASLTQLAAKSTNPQAFWRAALVTLVRGFGCPYGRLELQQAGAVIQLDHSDDDRAELWRDQVQGVVEDTLAEGPSRARLFTGRKTRVGIGLFGCALRGGAGAVGLVVACRGPAEADRIQERLDSLVALVAILAEEVEAHGPTRVETAERAASNANAVRRSAEYESTVQLAMAITNRLASREGFEQAAFARVRGTRVQLLAVSGLDHIDKKSPGIGHLKQAMGEAVDFGEAVLAQCAQRSTDEQPDLEPLPEGRLHRAWHDAVGHAPVCSIPLMDDDGVAAVLAVRRVPDATLDREEVEQLEKLVGPFAKALGVVERANRGLVSHAFERLLAAPLGFLSRHHIGRKLALVLLAVAGVWAVRGSLPYRVGAVTTIQPLTTRALGAPIDGVLQEAPHAPGDLLAAGALLARFDTEQLELEARRLESEIAILENDEKRAIAEGDPTAVQVGRAQREELLASLALVELQIDQAQVRAPYAGRLVEGDLRERIGDTFSKGEPLYRIAAEDGYRLEIVVDERDIDDVRVGQEGSFAAFARPEEKLPFRITLIHPTAATQGATHGYLVEAELLVDDQATWARPGMEGSGRIEVGERSPAWIGLHDTVDRLRMLSWQ